MAAIASVSFVMLRAAMSRYGTLLPWPFTSRIFAEAVMRQAPADIAYVLNEGLAPDGDRPGKIEVMLVERIKHGRHQDGFRRYSLHSAPRHLGGSEHVGNQRQMRPVLLDRADRQHGDAILRYRLANLRPGELFVSIFRPWSILGAGDRLFVQFDSETGFLRNVEIPVACAQLLLRERFAQIRLLFRDELADQRVRESNSDKCRAAVTLMYVVNP